jgi:FkbM family methyltransferase
MIIKQIKYFIKERYPLTIGLKVLFSEFLYKIRFILPSGYVLIKNSYGKVYLNLKESAAMIRRMLNIYEYWHMKKFKEVIKEGMVIVDVGANKGDYSLLAAKLMNDKGKVLCFEPFPENVKIIKKSIKANGYSSIRVFNIALFDKNKNIELFVGDKSGWHSIYYKGSSGKKIRVKAMKLDDILKNNKIGRIDVMKIDVEGAEFNVLKGAIKTIRKSRKMHLFIDLDNPKQAHKIFEFLKREGFNIFSIGRDMKRIKNDHLNKINAIYAYK